MFTMNQVEVLVESVKLLSIFGFIFFVLQMFLSHSLRMKNNLEDNINAEHYALRRRMIIGLGVLCICFFVALMFMNSFNNWLGYDHHDVLVTSDPRLMKEAINKVFDAFKLIVIFGFVSFGIRMVLNYREQLAKLKHNNRKNNDCSN